MNDQATPRPRHRPLLRPVLGAKYEDDEQLSIFDWDGTVSLHGTCGWTGTRIYSANDGLADVWRSHVTADTYGVEYRRQPPKPTP